MNEAQILITHDILDWNKPLVTIRCTTYNHKQYIRDAIDGFIMQKTTFPFVVIVHDDASTDGTAAIILEYAKKYPHIIKPIIETENQYSKHDGSVKRIMDEAIEATGCKYVAVCEGDDYWIDPLKLQKQVDFMESNPEHSMVFTNAEVKSDLKTYRKLDEHMYDHLEQKEYTGPEMLERWSLPTASLLCKKNVSLNVPFDKRFMFGDIVWTLWAASQGKLYCINEKTVVYRRHEGSATTSKGSSNHFERTWNHYVAIEEIFGAEYSAICRRKKSELMAGTFLEGKGGKLSWKMLCIVLRRIQYFPEFIASLFRIMKIHFTLK